MSDTIEGLKGYRPQENRAADSEHQIEGEATLNSGSNSEIDPITLREFQTYLKQCKKIVALVGAGLSVSSGLPTFRGTQGLWKNYNIIDLATPDAFYIDPGLVWQFYSWRRSHALEAEPNDGHRTLAKLALNPNVEFTTITQNVDGLLIRAGHPKKKLYEIHGSLFDLKCTSFMCTYVDHDNFTDPLTKELADSRFEHVTVFAGAGGEGDRDRPPIESPQFAPIKQIPESELPLCPLCNLLLRPGVVWFGESLPLKLITGVDRFIEQGEKVDLILVIGTSGTVYPANSYVDRVRFKGGKVAIFNTDIELLIMAGEDRDTWGFQGDAAKLLPIALAPLL
ncbi:uncharacterized protein KQ657_000011 [Scheffersomyces spartinae]|uniref:NAD-dependent protein deacylase n=1 Tax=Scheffersomyces spartinae TaxID=45513 RepID=A0A9P8AK16_9ASCO|nr:uncharacterized protein KQ657_000011 [Scheffersomyces spartinae]KAG7196005.1 hypothetical protein KQ657_000011 [Scheffersomyces spartinae]